MKQRKKSFGMRISAFVLSFAMVCTLLAGVNVVAFAADGDETVSVSKFYNDAKKGGDGEHLFTKDADEISWLSSLKTWNNEGEAWKAPVSSSTSVWRCYNPNSGEHLYVDEGYADYLAGSGWNKEKVAFYSDDEMGVPVYRLWNGQDGVGSHHFTTDAGEVDWLVGQGWTKEDVAFYGVANQSVVVKLIDENGLQSDGTALDEDTLSVTYGSDFGIPSRIIWYCDGAAKAVYTTEGGTIINAFNNAEIMTKNNNKMPIGAWYVTVENTKGNVYKTNTINVVEDSAIAEMTNFTIADNYDVIAEVENTPALAAYIPTVDTTTQVAVVDVTLNKDVAGTFYLVDSKVNKYAAADFANKVAVTGTTTDPAIYNCTKKSEFDNVTLAKKVQPGTLKGIKYVNTDGSVSYKLISALAAGQTITRGTDYMLVFDQEGTIAQTKSSAEWNTTDTFTCPYLYAPTDIEVVDAKPSVSQAGWGVQLYLGGTEALYINDLAGTGVGANMKLYSNSSSSTENGTKFDTGAYNFLLGGKTYSAIPNPANPTASTAKQNTAGHTTDEYVYATWSAPKGIFGESKIELVSDPVNVAAPVASAVEVKYDVTSPADVSASISNLKSDCQAFLVTADWDTDVTTTATAAAKDFVDNGNFVATTTVDKGSSSVTFEDAIDEVADKTNGDVYAVVLMPTNEDYSYVATVMAANYTPIKVTQLPTTYSLEGTTKELKGDGNATTAVLYAYDQFSDELGEVKSMAQGGCTFVPFSGASEDQQAKVATDANGAVKITLTDSTNGATIGDQYKYKLNPYQYLTLTCTTGGKLAASKWTASITAE